MAQLAFGIVQLRLAEALTVLAALLPAAVPGLFLGCLIANLANPASLGPLDILGGSLVTLVAALLTWRLSRSFKRHTALSRLIMLCPAVILNGLVVGGYLPFLIPDLLVSGRIIALSILSLLLSQALMVYLLGLPLLLALERTRIFEQE
jgi:uncharacterized membrane protein